MYDVPIQRCHYALLLLFDLSILISNSFHYYLLHSATITFIRMKLSIAAILSIAGASPAHAYAIDEGFSRLLGKASKSKGSTPSSSPSDSPSVAPSSAPSSLPSCFCRRRLKEGEEIVVKEDIPIEEVIEIIDIHKSMGAKRNASFSFKYDLISKKSCDILMEYLDSSLSCDVASGKKLPEGTASTAGIVESNESWIHDVQDDYTEEEAAIKESYHKKLYTDELVAMIGREETLNIIGFFEESLPGLTIDCMYLARHGDSGDDIFMVPWHMNPYSTLEITLNDNYDGGHVLHMNGDGIHKTESRPGSATGKISSFASVKYKMLLIFVS